MFLHKCICSVQGTPEEIDLGLWWGIQEREVLKTSLKDASNSFVLPDL